MSIYLNILDLDTLDYSKTSLACNASMFNFQLISCYQLLCQFLSHGSFFVVNLLVTFHETDRLTSSLVMP